MHTSWSAWPLQALFRRAQLKALVDIHSSTEGMSGGYLTNEEISVIRGALDLSGKQAVTAMTPLDKVSTAWPGLVPGHSNGHACQAMP